MPAIALEPAAIAAVTAMRLGRAAVQRLGAPAPDPDYYSMATDVAESLAVGDYVLVVQHQTGHFIAAKLDLGSGVVTIGNKFTTSIVFAAGATLNIGALTLTGLLKATDGLTVSGAPLSITAQRFHMAPGSASVASANALVLGTDGNAFEITGTTQINTISNASWNEWDIVALYFDGSVTVKHNQAPSGAQRQILLHGAADASMTANKILFLMYTNRNGTSGAWVEISQT